MYDHLDDPQPPDGADRLPAVHRSATRRVRRQRLTSGLVGVAVLGVAGVGLGPVLAGVLTGSNSLSISAAGGFSRGAKPTSSVTPREMPAPPAAPNRAPEPPQGGGGDQHLSVTEPGPSRPAPPEPSLTRSTGSSVTGTAPTLAPPAGSPTPPAAPAKASAPSPTQSPQPSPVATVPPSPAPSGTPAAPCLTTLPYDEGPPAAGMTLQTVAVQGSDGQPTSKIVSGKRFRTTLGARTQDGTTVRWQRDDQLAVVLLDPRTHAVVGSLSGPARGEPRDVSSPGDLPVATGSATRCDGSPVAPGRYDLSGGVWVATASGDRNFWRVDQPLRVTVTEAPSPSPQASPKASPTASPTGTALGPPSWHTGPGSGNTAAGPAAGPAAAAPPGVAHAGDEPA